jgi:hypothetical protein
MNVMSSNGVIFLTKSITVNLMVQNFNLAHPNLSVRGSVVGMANRYGPNVSEFEVQ